VTAPATIDEIELVAGAARATVHPAAGGRLGRLEVDDHGLLRGPEDAPPGAPWSEWGAYPLLPWSNRISGGTFTFEGRTSRVPVNWKDGTALHGLTAWRPWTVRSAELVIEVAVGPYQVAGRQRFALHPTHLDLELEVTNLGPDRVPVGLGIHPWFVAGPIEVPASKVWPGDPIPTGPARPVAPDEDLRRARVPPLMDRCYTGLSGTALHVPGLWLSWEGPITHVVVFTGVPGWVCVEPVTMANDGFRMADAGFEGTGVLALDPGHAERVAYRFDWS
jgi:aldose 1-epimerase